MGKPFASEMEKLVDTYQWAKEVDLNPLKEFIKSSSSSSLLSIGSGGSFTAATMAALLHQTTGYLSKALTPLEFEGQKNIIRNSNVLLLSAGGHNPDVLSAFNLAIRGEPKNFCSMILKKNSPLSELSSKYNYSYCLALDAPFGKDGFLATNSLLSFLVMLARAYSENNLINIDFPATISPNKSFIDSLSENVEKIYTKPNWMILFGGWGLPVSIDLESKFTESALGCAMVSDYRNFAHGRHNWIAKKNQVTNIIILATPNEIPIAKKTIEMLPEDVDTVEIFSNNYGPVGTLELLIKSFHLINQLGLKNGIDPGRPTVKDFGRKIYNHKYKPNKKEEQNSINLKPIEKIAIIRKIKNLNLNSLPPDEMLFWKSAYSTFVRKINSTQYGSIILDYDGTLCSTSDRYNSLTKDIQRNLLRILENDISIGIATGRGKSVRDVLRNVIPEDYWKLITIGYYNCSDVALLTEDNRPLKDGDLHDSLTPILYLLEENKILLKHCLIESRPNQISIIPEKNSPTQRIGEYLQDLIISDEKSKNVKIRESSHSIDIYPKDVSKLVLLNYLHKMLNKRPILCIGDKGELPGNDYDLLSSDYSLSVDTVSSSPTSCWNLSSPGIRGVDATIYYLNNVKPSRKQFTIKVG